MHGIGKRTALKQLHRVSLEKLGSNNDLEDIILEGSQFVAACYGFPEDTNMTTVRTKYWKKKTGPKGNLSQPIKMCSLPPINEALKQNILRA